MLLFDSNSIDETNWKTERLEFEAQKIVTTLKSGNSFKIGNAIGAGIGTLGLIAAGGGVVSPFIGLLLATGALSSAVAYACYCIDESEQLGVNPLWIPLLGGEEETVLSEILTDSERSHWEVIRLFGLNKVKKIEEAGLLDSLIEAVQDIDLEGVDDRERMRIYNQSLKQIKASVNLFPKPTTGIDRFHNSPRTRNLPETPDPDYWDDLQENHGTVDRYLLPTATADTLPKIRDLPQEIATLKRHVLFVASTTSGKTTALTQVITHALSNGHQVTVLDGKGNLALKNSGAIYRHCNTPERAMDAIDILERIVATMETRQDLALKGHRDFTPITIIIDELNLIRAFLKKVSKEAQATFDELIVHILLQGAASNIFLRLAAHTSRLPKLGLDGGEADSLSFVALGRNGSYESLEDCLDYQVNGRKSKKFQDELDGLIHESFRETLCFSTIAPMGFYRIPWVDQSLTAFAPKPEMDIRSSLDRLYQTTTAPEPTTKRTYTPATKSALVSPLKEIFEYAQAQEIVKARDIQNNVTGCKKIPPDEIRSMFLQLEEMEYGYTEGEGTQLSFSPYD